jgi:hypothetical protein
MSKKESGPGKDGSKQESDCPYYRSRRDEPRNFRRRMASRLYRAEAVAGDYIGYLPDLIERGEVKSITLYGRVSTDVQVRNGSLSDQMRKFKELVQPYAKSPYRIPVVARYGGPESGKQYERSKLRRAVAMARRENAVVVADTTDRLIRAEDYDPHDRETWKCRPTDAEYRRFIEANSGVVFATIGKRPDAGPRRTRGYQTKRGHEAKGNKGGRPKKLSRAERKELLLPKVMQLRQDTGRGCCWIAEQVGLSSKTVWEWLKEDV